MSLRLGSRTCLAHLLPRAPPSLPGSRSCLARSAPRAHVRELLCVSQSSKERLRRSRTESSGAAPAIEELPGAARQCKARRAACGEADNQLRPSHGRGGLEGVRPSSSREHQILAEVRQSTSLPTAHHRSRKFPLQYQLLPSAKRSGGRQALQLPRASNSCGSSISHLSPDRAPQKSELPTPVPSSPIREEPLSSLKFFFRFCFLRVFG